VLQHADIAGSTWKLLKACQGIVIATVSSSRCDDCFGDDREAGSRRCVSLTFRIDWYALPTSPFGVVDCWSM
jgi:hypothetical protein